MFTGEITVGMIFDTEFENGCVVTGPEVFNGFDGLDSDGEEVSFCRAMITRSY